MFNYDNLKNNAAGIGIGVSTYIGAKTLMKLGAKPYYKYLQKDFSQFNEKEIQYIKNEVNNTYNKAYLPSYNCKISNLNKKNSADFLEKFQKTNNQKKLRLIEGIENKLKKVFSGKFSPEIRNFAKQRIEKYKTKINNKETKKIFKMGIESVAEGKNAFYSNITKEIVVNLDKAPEFAFHEMGHAINYLGMNKVGNALAYLKRPFAAIAPIILAIALLKPKKQKNEKSEGIKDKTISFIKNNAGKLTFAALIPKLAEEGLASSNARVLLKMNNVDKKIAKRINLVNLKAWGTYLLGAIILSQATRLAIYTHDRIVENNKK